MTSPPKEVAWDPNVLEKTESGLPKNTGRRRSSAYGTYNRVVAVAVDTSDNSRRAFEWYVLNLWRTDDLVVLIHCPEPPKLPTFSWKTGLHLPTEEWKEILEEMNNKTKHLEEDYQTVCTMRKMKHKMKSEANQNVGEGIIKIALDEGADILVCGSKGVGDSYHSKRGGVAEYLARNSSSTVVVVPNRFADIK